MDTYLTICRKSGDRHRNTRTRCTLRRCYKNCRARRCRWLPDEDSLRSAAPILCCHQDNDIAIDSHSLCPLVRHRERQVGGSTGIRHCGTKYVRREIIWAETEMNFKD